MPRNAPRPREERADSKLSRLRIAAGYTQTQLADAVGVGVASIQRWEIGHVPNGKYLIALSRALGCTIEDILR